MLVSRLQEEEDEEDQVQCRIWMKMVACMLKKLDEDGGVCIVEEG